MGKGERTKGSWVITFCRLIFFLALGLFLVIFVLGALYVVVVEIGVLVPISLGQRPVACSIAGLIIEAGQASE